MRPLVSVIIPVYNVAGYLDECVNSVCTQTYRELEIILIDDGSTDGSGEMCDTYQDERIIVIHKKNAGVSAARNDGMDRASGEYILFVDSDDYISDDLVESLVDAAIKDNADCVISKDMQVDEEGNHLESLIIKNMPERMSGLQLLDEACKYGAGYLWGTVWAKLCRKDILDGIRFVDGKRHEDEFFVTRLYLKCEKIIYLKFPRYYYRENTKGFMQTDGVERFSATESYFDRADLISEVGMHAAALRWTMTGLRLLWIHYAEHGWKYNRDQKNRVSELQRQLRLLAPKLLPYAKKDEKFKLKIFSANMLVSAYAMGHHVMRKKAKRRELVTDALAEAALEIERQKKMIGDRDFSVISNNCYGGCYLSDMGRQFKTPTIKLYFSVHDFCKFVNNLQYYLSLELKFVRENQFPIGVLDDIRVHFMHYTSEEDARECWERRKTRVLYDKIVVTCADVNGMSEEDFEEWKKIKYPKVLFTVNKAFGEDPDSVYYPEYQPGENYDLIPLKKYLKDAAISKAVLSLDEVIERN